MCLNRLVDDSVANAQCVEVQGDTGNGALADEAVVLVEQVPECWAVVSAKGKELLEKTMQ